MTTDKESDAFTAWLATQSLMVQSWGGRSQHGFASMAWQARAALDMSDELAAALAACLRKGVKWHPCDEVVVMANQALTKYRSMKGEGV